MAVRRHCTKNRVNGKTSTKSCALLLATFVICAALPADAQTGARQIFGRADFELEWQSEPGDARLRLRYLAAERRLRIEALDGSGEAMIQDLGKGGRIVLVDEGKRGVYVAPAPPLAPFRGEAQAETRLIAGENCRDFLQDAAVYCLSDDGLPLVIEEGGRRLTATRLLRQRQNAALFSAPADAKPQVFPGRLPDAALKLPF